MEGYNPKRLMVEKESSRPILYEIGALVTTCAQIDYDMTMQLSRLVSPGSRILHEAGPLSVGMDFKVKMAVMRTLLTRLPNGLQVKAQKLCDQLQETYQRRNDVAHLCITGMKGDSCIFNPFRYNPKTGANVPPKLFTADQIRGWSKRMEILAIELDVILNEAGLPKAGELEPQKAKVKRSRSRSDPPTQDKE